MKKILALMITLVLALAFVGCGNNNDQQQTKQKTAAELESEKTAVSNALQGTWFRSEYSNTKPTEGTIIYMYSFSNGQYLMKTIQAENKTEWHSEKGTYTIDTEKEEILCVSDEEVLGSIMERTFDYKYNSGQLSISDSTGEFEKYKEQ